MVRFASALLLVLVQVAASDAHYNMLLPEVAYAKKGEPVSFTYQWGHPFEHELFDAPLPAGLSAQTPGGQHLDLASRLQKIRVLGADKKMVTAYRFVFIPEQRGDHTFMLTTPPIFLEGSNEFVQDIVKVVLHVSTQKAWDADPGRHFRIVSVTRPYGLYPGMVFQARVLLDGAAGGSEAVLPLKHAVVEFERYNSAPPKELPIDELITFKTKTDAQGLFSVAFPEPGWWCITTQRDAGTREHNGRQVPVRQRVTLWLHVDKKH